MIETNLFVFKMKKCKIFSILVFVMARRSATLDPELNNKCFVDVKIKIWRKFKCVNGTNRPPDREGKKKTRYVNVGNWKKKQIRFF